MIILKTAVTLGKVRQPFYIVCSTHYREESPGPCWIDLQIICWDEAYICRVWLRYWG